MYGTDTIPSILSVVCIVVKGLINLIQQNIVCMSALLVIIQPTYVGLVNLKINMCE